MIKKAFLKIKYYKNVHPSPIMEFILEKINGQLVVAKSLACAQFVQMNGKI